MKEMFDRLKTCYCILTSHTYYVFCFNKSQKIRRVEIENPTKWIDGLISGFLQSDKYTNLKKRCGYDK